MIPDSCPGKECPYAEEIYKTSQKTNDMADDLKEIKDALKKIDDKVDAIAGKVGWKEFVTIIVGLVLAIFGAFSYLIEKNNQYISTEIINKFEEEYEITIE